MLSAVLIVLAQPAKSPSAEAEKLVSTAKSVIEKSTLPTTWVMKKSGKWSKMKNENAHLTKEGMWDDKVSLVVSVAHAAKQFIVVGSTAGSSSGDVFDFTQSYYWPDGKLACVEYRAARIDYGGQTLTRWFDRSGKPVKKVEAALDGESQETTAPTAVKISKEFALGSRPFVTTYAKQPFAKLAPVK